MNQDMTPLELQLCYDEYRDDPEVQMAWTKAQVENSIMMSLGLYLNFSDNLQG